MADGRPIQGLLGNGRDQERVNDMTRYLCHEQPDLLVFDTQVIDYRPGAVVLERSAFYPGGGGQLADRGVLRWESGEAPVQGVEIEGDRHWHLISGATEPRGTVQGTVDAEFRGLMCQLHTGLHVLNALVFRTFNGALVTSAQMMADGTARHDFDLPGADNAKLRELEAVLNDVIRQDLAVRAIYVAREQAAAEPGLIRNKSVAPPPQPDGTLRVVEIDELDRQACGGTHLRSTGESRAIRILKVDNKGRHNRRVYIGLQSA